MYLTQWYGRKLASSSIILDPDAIAREINPNDPSKAAIQAARIVLKSQQDFLRSGQSFTLETTLSSKGNLELIEAAKAQNWLVRLLYVGLGNPTMNVQRVASRVGDGGHDVPEEDIRRRFERSMANLPIAADLVDLLSVYDNSDRNIRRVLLIKNHRIRRYASSNGKNWWEIALDPYLKSLESRA